MTVADPTFVPSHDGTPIAVHPLGGSGPPLVLCHATGFHARAYLPLVPRLAQSFSVFGVDLRGHGASQLAEDATFVWHDFAGDLLAVIDHLGGGPVAAFGHSMGGATILLAEAERRGSIERAWLFEPIIFPAEIGPRNSFMADNARKRRAEFATRAEALERYASRAPLNVLRADALAAYVQHGFVDNDDGTVRLACRPVHEAMTFEGARIPVGEVAHVDVPIVVARGHVPEGPSAADFAAGTAAALPAASLQVYERIGHFGPLELPDRVADDAASFLTS